MEKARHTSLWQMIAAPIVWAVHFCAVYAWTASACAHAGAAEEARLGVALMTLAALGLIAVFAWRAWRQWDLLSENDHVHDAPTDGHRRRFLGHAGLLLSMVSAIGVSFVAAPAFYIGSCL